jgi:hypothetical protein
MNTETVTTIRMFGALHAFRKERGLEPAAEVEIPPEGRQARDVARALDLPMEKISAVFVNHVAHDLDVVIHSHDRVAFIPTGIPTTERVLLGISKG